MLIYYLSHSKIPSQFANSVNVMKMCNAFVHNGHTVVLFAKQGLDSSGQDDFKYYGVAPSFRIQKIKLINHKIIGAIKYILDVVHYIKHSPSPDIFYTRYIYCASLVTNFKIPIYMEVHQPPQNLLELLLFKRLIKAPSFERLITISQKLKEKYRKVFPELEEKKILVAHDGADAISEHKINFDNISLLGKGHSLKVGYLGSLYKGRGIELICALARNIPDIDFHVIGGTAKEVKHFKRITNDLKNIFFYGYIEPQKCDAYRLKMDILIAPFQKKVAPAGNKGNIAGYSSPIKLFEYMAAGKPIISSNLPTMTEFLKDGEDAFLVDSENITAWKKALAQCRDKGLRDRLGKNARQKLSEHYTWQARAAKVILKG